MYNQCFHNIALQVSGKEIAFSSFSSELAPRPIQPMQPISCNVFCTWRTVACIFFIFFKVLKKFQYLNFCGKILRTLIADMGEASGCSTNTSIAD